MPYIEEEKNTLTANGQLPIPDLLWMYLKIEVDIGGCLRAQEYGAGLQHIEGHSPERECGRNSGTRRGTYGSSSGSV